MRKLEVFLERLGSMVKVGSIIGNTSEDACFCYDEEYVGQVWAIPLCLALPLSTKQFDPRVTRGYFDGLLPEGFTRRCVAGAVRTDEDDYLSILANLGSECIGAVMVLEEGRVAAPAPHYRRLAEGELAALAREGASESAQMVVESHVSLAGASGKVGMYLDSETKEWLVPCSTAPSTHIIKQGHVRYGNMVVNEQLCLSTARLCGLPVPESFIIQSDEPLFATARFDRTLDSHCRLIDGFAAPYRLHQQDFAQALGIVASAKYEPEGERYLARCFDLLRRRSTEPLADVIALWDSMMFGLLVGNADGHLKNYALLYSPDWSALRIAPTYDLVSTVVYPKTSRALSMAIGGIRDIRKVTRKDVAAAAKEAGLGERFGLERFDRLNGRFECCLRQASEELAQAGFDAANDLAEEILRERRARLF